MIKYISAPRVTGERRSDIRNPYLPLNPDEHFPDILIKFDLYIGLLNPPHAVSEDQYCLLVDRKK